MNNLAMAYRDIGQFAKAVPLLELALAKRTEKLGPDHPRTLQSMNNLAMAYRDIGQFAKAVPLLEQALAKRKEKLGPDHADTLRCMNNLASAYHKNGDFTRAEPILRECLTIRQEKQPDAWTTFHTQSQLGGSLLGRKNYAEAEPPLLAGYEGMKEREAKIPPNANSSLTEAVERLVQLYDAWGKKDQADAWRQRLSEHAGPKSP
jgi:tetratricopeptide (TPR) repeat protein